MVSQQEPGGNTPLPSAAGGGTQFYIIPRKLLFHSLAWQLFFAIPLISFFVFLILGWHIEPLRPGDGTRTFAHRLTVLHMWAALFFSAALFSCIGSLVSYAGRDHSTEQNIQYGSLALSMHLVGSVFGIILLLLFLGGFIAGTLFPDFSNVGFFRVFHNFYKVQDWAKLFVWAFIAGFSERLMPDLLQNVARRISVPD
jgi:hypothetical protein